MRKVQSTKIHGLFLIYQKINSDLRGNFLEIYKEKVFREHSFEGFIPAQISISVSKKDVIRGFHYSNNPIGQAKLVTVLDGKILDTIVDIRKESPTFRETFQIELKSEEGITLFMPTGVAHGFSVQTDAAMVLYVMSSEYSPELEFGINPLDPDLGIDWKVDKPILSEKDKNEINFKHASSLHLLPSWFENEE